MTEIDFGEIKSTEIFGYSPLDARDLAEKIATGTKSSHLPGDFTLVVEGENADRHNYVAVIVSAVCVLSYYYYHDDCQFVHGQNIFAVFKQAQIDWQWNDDALSSMVALNHCLGNDSLHQDIKRTEPATIYYYCDKQLTIVGDTFPIDIFKSGESIDAGDALKTYDNVFDEYYSDRQICLSLSAGYDSRVLLASLLKRGIKPPVGTEGDPSSIDVITATAIAKDFGLEHRLITLTEADFIDNADLVVEATSGELPISAAWGSYLFLKQVEFPSDALHLAGTNGGLFKANFFNRAVYYQLADLLPDPALKQFFNAYQIYKQRLYKGFPKTAWRWNQETLKTSVISDRCYQLAAAVRNFSPQVDYFHSFYRVRNYTGKGLSLYNLVNLTSSPFLDYRMVEAGAKLAKKYKVDCFLHQYILLNTCPQLAEYPMNGINISPSRSTKYAWLEQQAKQPSKVKSLNSKLMENPELIDICYNSPHLDYFMARKDRQRAVESKIFAIFSLLLTMHYVAEKAARISKQ